MACLHTPSLVARQHSRETSSADTKIAQLKCTSPDIHTLDKSDTLANTRNKSQADTDAMKYDRDTRGFSDAPSWSDDDVHRTEGPSSMLCSSLRYPVHHCIGMQLSALCSLALLGCVCMRRWHASHARRVAHTSHTPSTHTTDGDVVRCNHTSCVPCVTNTHDTKSEDSRPVMDEDTLRESRDDDGVSVAHRTSSAAPPLYTTPTSVYTRHGLPAGAHGWRRVYGLLKASPHVSATRNSRRHRAPHDGHMDECTANHTPEVVMTCVPPPCERVVGGSCAAVIAAALLRWLPACVQSRLRDAQSTSSMATTGRCARVGEQAVRETTAAKPRMHYFASCTPSDPVPTTCVLSGAGRLVRESGDYSRHARCVATTKDDAVSMWMMTASTSSSAAADVVQTTRARSLSASPTPSVYDNESDYAEGYCASCCSSSSSYDGHNRNSKEDESESAQRACGDEECETHVGRGAAVATCAPICARAEREREPHRDFATKASALAGGELLHSHTCTHAHDAVKNKDSSHSCVSDSFCSSCCHDDSIDGRRSSPSSSSSSYFSSTSSSSSCYTASWVTRPTSPLSMSPSVDSHVASTHGARLSRSANSPCTQGSPSHGARVDSSRRHAAVAPDDVPADEGAGTHHHSEAALTPTLLPTYPPSRHGVSSLPPCAPGCAHEKRGANTNSRHASPVVSDLAFTHPAVVRSARRDDGTIAARWAALQQRRRLQQVHTHAMRHRREGGAATVSCPYLMKRRAQEAKEEVTIQQQQQFNLQSSSEAHTPNTSSLSHEMLCREDRARNETWSSWQRWEGVCWNMHWMMAHTTPVTRLIHRSSAAEADVPRELAATRTRTMCSTPKSEGCGYHRNANVLTAAKRERDAASAAEASQTREDTEWMNKYGACVTTTCAAPRRASRAAATTRPVAKKERCEAEGKEKEDRATSATTGTVLDSARFAPVTQSALAARVTCTHDAVGANPCATREDTRTIVSSNYTKRAARVCHVPSQGITITNITCTDRVETILSDNMNSTNVPIMRENEHDESVRAAGNAAESVVPSISADEKALTWAGVAWSAALPMCEPRRDRALRGVAGRCGEMQIGAFLGGGACGKVYECLNMQTGAVYAVKQICLDKDDPTLRQRLRQLRLELEVLTLAARCESRWVVGYHGAERRGHSVLMYLEYCEHGSLLDYLVTRTRMRRCQGGGVGGEGDVCAMSQDDEVRGELEEGEVCVEDDDDDAEGGETLSAPTLSQVQDFTRQITTGLDFLHGHGYAHLDIKTANVLLTARGECRLADLGCAMRLQSCSAPTTSAMDAAGSVNSVSSLSCSVFSSSYGAMASVSETDEEEAAAAAAEAPTEAAEVTFVSRPAKEKQPAAVMTEARTTGAAQLSSLPRYRTLQSYEHLTELRGTAMYMAPEMIRFERARIGSAADIWSLGCVVMELVTGSSPWRHLGSDKMCILLRVGNARCALPLPPTMRRRIGAARRVCAASATAPRWARLYDALGDFVEHCLCLDPNARRTASELMQHPFLNM